MKSTFAGIPAEGMQFLADLKKNNDREWFNPRKQIFEEKLRQPMLELIKAVQEKMVSFAPEYVGEPAKSLYRIYRDTRFSKNKTPYKTHVAALFWRNGFGKDDGAGFFFMVSPETVEIGGGIYNPMPDTLLAVRQHLAGHAAEFQKTYRGTKVKKLLGDLQGDAVKRMPKGFSQDHPAADLLRRKQFMLYTTIDGAIASTPRLLTEITSRLEAMSPFVRFLNVPLAGLKRTADAKFYAE